MTRHALPIGFLLVLLSVACGDPVAPAGTGARPLAADGTVDARDDAPGVDAAVCHRDAGGGAREIAAHGRSRRAHLAHGDYDTRLVVDPDAPAVESLRFSRITDALDRARAIRLTQDERTDGACRIHVRIAAGEYLGSFDAGAGAAMERFPLIVDVPDVSLVGATRLALDPRGRPLPPDDEKPATLLRPDRTLAFLPVTEAMIVVLGRPGGSAGDGTELAGLSFASGPAEGGMGIITLRARRLRITGNHFGSGLSSAADLRGSDAIIATNLTERIGANCAFCVVGPGRYTIRDNRIRDGRLGGIYLGAAIAHIPIAVGADSVAPIEPDVLPSSAAADADVQNNAVSGHRRLPIGFALRVLALGPGASHVPQMTNVRVRDNDFFDNTFGVIADAGFPVTGTLRRGDLALSLAGNRILGSCQAPLLIALTRHTGALGLTTNPYLTGSTISLDLDGAPGWSDAWYAHPDGHGNTLVVDGLPRPNGARTGYDPTRSCP